MLKINTLGMLKKNPRHAKNKFPKYNEPYILRGLLRGRRLPALRGLLLRKGKRLGDGPRAVQCMLCIGHVYGFTGHGHRRLLAPVARPTVFAVGMSLICQ